MSRDAELPVKLSGCGFKKLHRIVRWNAVVPAGLERSVLQHSTGVAKMAGEIGLGVGGMLRALVHDALELYSGDIQTLFKTYLSNVESAEWRFFIDHSERVRSDFMPTVPGWWYYLPWRSLHKEDICGPWLRFLDHLDGWLEVREMVSNGVMHEQFDRYQKFLVAEYPGLANVFSEQPGDYQFCSTCRHSAQGCMPCEINDFPSWFGLQRGCHLYE